MVRGLACAAGWCCSPSFAQESSIERQRQQILQTITSRRALEVAKNHFQVAAEFPEDLPAGAARRRRRLGVGDDGDAREVPMPFGDRLEYCDALGTDRQAIGRVFDITAGDDGASRAFQRCTDQEMRIRRVRVQANGTRGIKQSLGSSGHDVSLLSHFNHHRNIARQSRNQYESRKDETRKHEINSRESKDHTFDDQRWGVEIQEQADVKPSGQSFKLMPHEPLAGLSSFRLSWFRDSMDLWSNSG